MSGLIRRARFWIAYAILAALATWLAGALFPAAIPLVSLDIQLARHEAIAKAQETAARLAIAPPGALTAAQFGHDGQLQNYVELEGGGKRAFTALVAGGRYSPYWWNVRLFRPGVVEEATIRFRPDGVANGFVRRVAEDYVRDPATMALSPADARFRAEERAAADWQFDPARHRLVQQSHETRASGRVDHQFVYEQPEPIGEARIRLRLAVAGDELTQVMPFAHVPESFGRRYEEMRSANELLAGIASGAAGLLYGVGGCIVAVLWLLRQRWLVWRPALVAGLVVGGLLGAAVLAAYPARWMSFDTATDATLFWVRHLAGSLAAFVGGGLALALVFMAAESLVRRAFPDHPQLWRLWSRAGGASVQTLGRTAGGYLFVPLELAFVVLFYYATNRYLGWWQPSEALTDPNILSSAVPALQPIAMALQAGFMEECMFRAVPLSLGALIGARFGRRTTGIAIAFVLQAFVFGGAHANYPGLPAYSRLAELILPSMAWALIFLRFGLLPVILLHALFDLLLMSIPIFLVDAPGSTLQRAIVIGAACVPLLVVALRRGQRGAWIEMPDTLRNRAWRPLAAMARRFERDEGRPSRWRSAVQRALPMLGIAGVLVAGLGAGTRTDVPPLTIGRAEAITVAERALSARGVDLGPDWRRSADIRLSGDDASHIFVWREAGPERYRALVGHVLAPPVWEVRFATFDADVAERADEWRIGVDGSGSVRVVNHTLPEARPGARLSQQQALALAAKAVRAELDLDVSELRLVGGQDQARPARTDWTFVWHDPRIDAGPGGEAWLRASVLGDEATGIARTVRVPEAWSRAERLREEWLRIARLAAAVVVAVAALAALAIGILAWSRGHSDRRASALVAGIVAAVGIARAALSWPEFEFGLGTTESIAAQLAMKAIAELLMVLLLALLSGLLAGVGAWWARSAPRHRLATSLPPSLAGIAAAFAVAGVASLPSYLLPDLAPDWPSYPFEGTALPALAAALQSLRLPAAIGVTLFALAALSHFTANGRRHAWVLPSLLAFVFGMQPLETGSVALLPIAGGMVAGAVAAAVVDAVMRVDPRTVPSFVVTGAILVALDSALGKASTEGYALFAIQVACMLAVGAICARYLVVPLPSPPSNDLLSRPAGDHT